MNSSGSQIGRFLHNSQFFRLVLTTQFFFFEINILFNKYLITLLITIFLTYKIYENLKNHYSKFTTPQLRPFQKLFQTPLIFFLN